MIRCVQMKKTYKLYPFTIKTPEIEIVKNTLFLHMWVYYVTDVWPIHYRLQSKQTECHIKHEK